jgi:hypothetical protein
MKIIFALLFTVLLFSSLQGQEKGDNLIVITTNRSPEENFQQFGRHLISEGYSFESKDADFFTLRTNVMDCRGGGGLYNYIMNISFVDSIITIRVNWLAHSLDPQVQPQWKTWAYSAFGGNINYHIFNSFAPKLRQYNFPVRYRKE